MMANPGVQDHTQVFSLDGVRYLVATPQQASEAGGGGRVWTVGQLADQEAPVEEEMHIREDHFHEGGGFSFEGIEHSYELARGWDASTPGKIGTWPLFASGDDAVSPDYRGWLVQHESYLYQLRGRYGSKYALDELQLGVELAKTGSDKDFDAGKVVAGRPVSVAGQLVIPILTAATGVLEIFELITTVGSPDTYATVAAPLKGRCFTVWNEKLVMAFDNQVRMCDTAAAFETAANWAPDVAGDGHRLAPDGATITDLLVYGPYLIAWTDLGPYYCNEDLRPVPGIPELAGEADVKNGIGVAVANGAILAPSRGGLVRWIPDGPWARVGPEMEGALEGALTPGWGRVSGLASYGGSTFLVANDAANAVASLLSFMPPRNLRGPYAVHFHQQEEDVTFEDVAVVLASAQPLQGYAFGTISDDSAVGTITWADTANAGAADGAAASAAAGTSHYLKLLNPNPNLPDDAELLGVELIVKRSVGAA